MNRSEKNSKKQDELDARVIGEGGDKNRLRIAVPLPYVNATSLASMMHVVGSTRRIALIEEGLIGKNWSVARAFDRERETRVYGSLG